jgi:hypothetical protein
LRGAARTRARCSGTSLIVDAQTLLARTVRSIEKDRRFSVSYARLVIASAGCRCVSKMTKVRGRPATTPLLKPFCRSRVSCAVRCASCDSFFRQMLKDFGPRLIQHILFLRNVATVTLSVWHDNEPQPHVLHCGRMGDDGCNFRMRYTVCCCCLVPAATSFFSLLQMRQSHSCTLRR